MAANRLKARTSQTQDRGWLINRPDVVCRKQRTLSMRMNRKRVPTG
jgi:hypothetical protein